jgi:hypothetical protein
MHSKPSTAVRLASAPARNVTFVSPWRGIVRALLLAFVVLTFVTTAQAAEQAPASEDQLKAAFLVNFPKYVDWPAAAFANATSPIVLTIVSDKAVENEVRRMTSGKLFNGRTLEVRSAGIADSIAEDCLILFIGVAEERKASQVIARLGGRSVLTVGECDDFFEDGGMIKLVRRNHKIKLEVNLAPAEAARLKISSKLLSVADVVKRKGDTKP